VESPKSTHSLPAWLPEAGVAYEWALSGSTLRQPSRSPPHHYEEVCMLFQVPTEKDMSAMANQTGGVQIIKPLQLNDHTPQTSGLLRLAALTHDFVGAEKLGAGVMLLEPNTVSAVHHHGAQETVVYVAEGQGKIRWGRRLEHEVDLQAGDFLFIPPLLPHQEINPSSQPGYWVVVRSGREPVVVNLTKALHGEEYVAEALNENEYSHTI
jgi:uncharacterized RmlC-like cupin family protein